MKIFRIVLNITFGAIIGAMVCIGLSMISVRFVNHTKILADLQEHKKDTILVYTRDVYMERLESKFIASREYLANEVEKYIKTYAPTAVISPLKLIDLCTKYNIDIRFVLAQGHIESHFGTKGTAARTNSVFNVGAYDGHSADQQHANGFGYRHPDMSIEPYLILLRNNYLVDGKTEQDLMDDFVNKNGHRYASADNYEDMLKSIYNKIDDTADISRAYEVYRMYQIQMGW